MRWGWLAAGLAMMSWPAQAAWQEATSSHFVVYSEEPSGTLTLFTQKLERFDTLMRLMRGLPDDHPDPARRVTVFMVRDEDAVHKLYGAKGSDVAGFYDPRASGSVAFVPRRSRDDGTGFSPLVILLHEYAHHFMFSTMGSAPFPGWVVEGYAEFFGPTSIKDDGGAMIGVAPQFRAWGMLDTATMPASRLLVADPNTLNDQARAVFYSRSWLLMPYLMMDADRRKQLSAYVGAIARGMPLAEAAKLLGPSGKLDHQLNAYVEQRSLHGFVMAPGKLPVPTVAVRSLSPGETAVMPARIASARGVDAKSAPAVAALARRLAAPYPNDPAVQNVVAEAEYDAGGYDASRAAAERALAADPKSIHALLYEGMARMGAAHHAGSGDAAAWSDVRHWFSKANHLDPENPYPLVLYFDSFGMAGQPATANAEAGLLYAQALAPFDLGLTLNAARVLLKQGKDEPARRLLETVAYNPHGGALSTVASKALEALNGPAGSGDARRILEGPAGGDEAKTPT